MTLVVFGALLATQGCGRAGSDAVPDAALPAAIELPARSSRPGERVAGSPDVPPEASVIPALSFRVDIVRRGPGVDERLSQLVRRTAAGIHIVPTTGGMEWYFEPNPVDPRRATGYLIDHAARQIVTYHDSDLRNQLGLRGWADILTMRVDLEALRHLEPTGERQALLGTSFTRRIATTSSQSGLRDVWWSDAWLMPRRLVVDDRGTTVTTEVEELAALDPGTPPSSPLTSHPTYTRLDAADVHDRVH